MTIFELNAKIRALPPEQQEEARYLATERLGILCGEDEPTPEQIDIVARQIFDEPSGLPGLFPP